MGCDFPKFSASQQVWRYSLKMFRITLRAFLGSDFLKNVCLAAKLLILRVASTGEELTDLEPKVGGELYAFVVRCKRL